MEKIRIAVSRCLLGERVRYDGRDKRERTIVDTLGRVFTFVGVCPEVECGLGVPREPVHLVGAAARPRMVEVRTGADHTQRMRGWTRRRLAEWERENVHGCILKARSPSCGLENIPVCRAPRAASRAAGHPDGRVAGLFARAVMERFPVLPCIDEDRLNDPDRRVRFFARVLAVWRFRRATRAWPFAAGIALSRLRSPHGRRKR